jgi:hypothetical protein
MVKYRKQEEVMDILQTVGLIFGIIVGNGALVIPLFLWNRSESRADMRHMDNKLEAYRLETKAMIQAIHDEMKDFHNRLFSLEERFKK